AWKHQDKKDYFFGAHDDNRVQITVGREIRLDPPRQGAPLNYFIYPYGELDGKPLALASQFTFHDRMNAAASDSKTVGKSHVNLPPTAITTRAPKPTSR